LILLAIGVPRETVFDDFKLSDQIVDYEAEINAEAETGSNPTSEAIARMAPETRNALFRSDPRYLEKSLDSIESRYGSISAYLQEVIGLDGKSISRLRELYLE
jgi:protein-tyrosine phosphatase